AGVRATLSFAEAARSAERGAEGFIAGPLPSDEAQSAWCAQSATCARYIGHLAELGSKEGLKGGDGSGPTADARIQAPCIEAFGCERGAITTSGPTTACSPWEVRTGATSSSGSRPWR